MSRVDKGGIAEGSLEAVDETINHMTSTAEIPVEASRLEDYFISFLYERQLHDFGHQRHRSSEPPTCLGT